MRAGVFGCLTLAATIAAAAPASAATRVVATTADLAALAAAVGENLVEVETVVPPGSDPEAFEPRPGDLDKVRHADILVRVGLGYDYWLDPENAAIVTAGIAEALARRIPAEAARILANRERFLGELNARLQRWSAQLAAFTGVKLIAYHNSWPYFARRFRLDIVDFIEPKPGVAPSPAHLAKLIAEGRRANVRAILHEPYEPDDASRLVAQKLGVPFVLLATSVESVAGVKDYLDLFEYNTATLAKALGAPGE